MIQNMYNNNDLDTESVSKSLITYERGVSMEQIRCAKCRSIDVVVDGKICTCKSCGAKWILDDGVSNLYIIARRAKENRDFKTAQMNYEAILKERPNDWEALFYALYCREVEPKIKDIPVALNRINICLHSVFDIIQKDLVGVEQEDAIYEIVEDVTSFATGAYNSAHNFKWGNFEATLMNNDLAQLYIDASNASVSLLLNLAIEIEDRFSNDAKYKNILHDIYVDKLEKIFVQCRAYLDAAIISTVYARVDKYDPQFSTNDKNHVAEKKKEFEKGQKRGGLLLAVTVVLAVLAVVIWVVAKNI